MVRIGVMIFFATVAVMDDFPSSIQMKDTRFLEDPVCLSKLAFFLRSTILGAFSRRGTVSRRVLAQTVSQKIRTKGPN